MKSLCACSRESINRQKLRDNDIFTVWKETLERKVSSNQSESEELLLEAKKVILTSLCNFYYDVESINFDFTSNSWEGQFFAIYNASS